MANNQTENNMQHPSVTLREGKWVTSDGLCFNTAAKAWQHINEISEPEETVVEDDSEEPIVDNDVEPESEEAGENVDETEQL